MEQFPKELANNIINLFLNPSDSTNFCLDSSSLNQAFVKNEELLNSTLRVSIILAPKSELYHPFEIVTLEIRHQMLEKEDSPDSFRNLESIVNDDPNFLAKNLRFLNKFFLSACFTSPYTNFPYNRNSGIELVRRKFIISHQIEHVTPMDIKRKTVFPAPSVDGFFVFNKSIENLNTCLQISMIVAGNFEITLSKIKMIEQIRQQTQNGSEKGKRSRFYSEHTDCLETLENEGDSSRLTGRKSELRIQISEEPIQMIKNSEKPFRFANENNSNDFERADGEDEEETRASKTKRLKNCYSGSIFTDDIISMPSKAKLDQKATGKDPLDDIDLSDFAENKTLRNILFMAKNLNKFIHSRNLNFNENQSISSKSVTAVTLINRKDSVKSLNCRNFAKFTNN